MAAVQQRSPRPEAESESDAEGGVPLLGVVLDCHGYRSPEGHLDGPESAVQGVATRRQDARSIAQGKAALQPLICERDAGHRVSRMETTRPASFLDSGGEAEPA